MDLTYTDASRQDIGVLMGCTLDLAYGADENNFELTVPAAAPSLDAGALLYMEGTEYGGIVDGMRYTSSSRTRRYFGRTWHGVLDSKIIQPDSGEDYYTVSGEGNQVLSQLVERLTLSALFDVGNENSSLEISEYQFPRYVTGYAGILAMLEEVGGKLQLTVQPNGKILLCCRPAMDYSAAGDWSSDQVPLDATVYWQSCNHLICLGKGDLAERQVIHLYADKKGKISNKQTFLGAEEYCALFELSNAESLSELRAEGVKHFKELRTGSKCEASVEAGAQVYDIGDTISASDATTGLSVTVRITKKVVKVENDRVTISYETGGD